MIASICDSESLSVKSSAPPNSSAVLWKGLSFRAGQLDGNRKWVKLSSSAGLYAKRELILINAGCLYENAKSVLEIRGHASHIVRLRFWLFVVYKHILVFLSFLLIYNARESFLSKVLSFLSTLDLENLPLQWVLKTKTCPYSKIRLSGFRGFDKVTHKGVLQTENKTRRESLETQTLLALVLMDVPWWTIHLWCNPIKMSSNQIKDKKQPSLLTGSPKVFASARLSGPTDREIKG